MPVTFVDGSRAELVFDEGLRPGDLGAYGFTSGGLGGIDRTLVVRYGKDRVYEMNSGPLQTYEGHDGSTVEEWEPPPEGVPTCPHLLYRFGNWFVAVRTCQGQLSAEEKARWARSLIGRVSEDDFLVLDAREPLVLQGTGRHEGPQLLLQGPEDGWPFMTLTPMRCDPMRPAGNEDVRIMGDGQRVRFSRAGRTWDATWCADGGLVFAVESPDRGYVEAAAQGLRVRKVLLSGDP